MPAQPLTIAPEIIHQARQRYRDGVPADEIAASAGISTGTLYIWLDGKVPSMAPLAPIPRRRPGTRRSLPSKSDRRMLVVRIWRAANAHMREIEQRLAEAGEPKVARDRDMRSMGSLVKMLRDLEAFGFRDLAAKPKAETAETDEEEDTRDIDEFRRDLARQMDAIMARRADRAADDSERQRD